MADQPIERRNGRGALALLRLAESPEEEASAFLSWAEERAWALILDRFLADTAADGLATFVQHPGPGLRVVAEPPADPESEAGGTAATTTSAGSAARTGSRGTVAPAVTRSPAPMAADLGGALHAASDAVRASLSLASSGTQGLSTQELRQALSSLGALTRAVAGLQASFTRELLVRPPSPSAGPVHKQLGYPSVRVALEHVLGLSTTSAHALVDIAESTAPRHGFSAGELAPSYPVLAAALTAGEVSTDQARTITQGLPSDHRRLDPAALEAAEGALVGAATAGAVGTPPTPDPAAAGDSAETIPDSSSDASAEAARTGAGAEANPPAAPGDSVMPVASGRGSLDALRLRPVALRDQAKLWAAFLDPDGPEPNERKQRETRYLHLTQQANGMWSLRGLAPAFEGAQLKTLLDALTSPARPTAAGQAEKSARPATSGDQGKAGATGADEAPRSSTATESGSVPAAESVPGTDGVPELGSNDGRSPAQRRFDALAAVVAHYATAPTTPSVGGAAPTLLVLTTAAAFAACAAEAPETPAAHSERPSRDGSCLADHHVSTGRAQGSARPSTRTLPSRNTGPFDGEEGSGAPRSAADHDAPHLAARGHVPGVWTPPQADVFADGAPRSTHGSPASGALSPPPGFLPPDPAWAPSGTDRDSSRAGWTPPDHTGLGQDPDDPFDPLNFAGAGWAAQWNHARDSWADLDEAHLGPDPFDPATFAGRGWHRADDDSADDERWMDGIALPGAAAPGVGAGRPETVAGTGAGSAGSGARACPPAAGTHGGYTGGFFGPVAERPSLALPPRPEPEPRWQAGHPGYDGQAGHPGYDGQAGHPGHAGYVEAAEPEPLRAVLGANAWLPHTQQVVSLGRVAHLVCSGAVQFLETTDEGHPLRLGRGQRLFTTHQRKAMIARDLHCRAPGCVLPAAFCETHHLNPWHLGGASDVEQGILLCPFHHHLAHQEHGR